MNTLTEAVRLEVLDLLASMKEDVQHIFYHGGPLDANYDVPHESKWQPLPGRPGVQFFHVPAANGSPALNAALFETLPGSRFTGSIMNCSRLLILSRGVVICNGKILVPGRTCWLAPEEPTTWHSQNGCQGVIFYGVPNPGTDYPVIVPPILPPPVL